MTDLEKKVLDRYRDFRIAFEALCEARYAEKQCATNLHDGLMSAADKAKLDSLDRIIAELQTSISGGDSSARADIVTLQSAVTNLQTQIAGLSNISTLQSSLADIQAQVAGLSNFVTLQTSISDLQTSLGNVQTSLGNVQTSLGNETTARTQADAALQTSIGNETTARTQADVNLQEQINFLNAALSVPAFQAVNFTIASADWSLDSTESSNFTYTADINIAGLSSSDYAVVDFTRDSQERALDSNVCLTAEISSGKIQLFAENAPSDSLAGQVTVWKG